MSETECMKIAGAVLIALGIAAVPCLAGVVAMADDAHGLRCSLHAKSARWTKGLPVLISIDLENRNSEPKKFMVVSSFEVGDMHYWAPVRLAAISEPLPANTKYEMFLSPGQRQTFEVDLSKLKWERSIAAPWPHRDLFELVSSGTYELSLCLELHSGETSTRIYSNRVEVTVQRGR